MFYILIILNYIKKIKILIKFEMIMYKNFNTRCHKK